MPPTTGSSVQPGTIASIISMKRENMTRDVTGTALSFFSGAGLIGAISFALLILPWDGARTIGQQVSLGVSITAAATYTILAWAGYFLLELRKSLRGVMWAMLIACAVHLLAGIALTWSMYDEVSKIEWMTFCLKSDPTFTDTKCQSRLTTLQIFVPTGMFLVPICGVALCYCVHLFTTSDPHDYALTRPLMDETPPNWDRAPDSYAPDSSASDDEGYSRYEFGKRYARPRYERKKSKRSDSSTGTGSRNFRSSNKKGKQRAEMYGMA